MRVIGGSAKGRRLGSVPGDGTRPILDRVKVPLFDILRPRLPGMRMLDMFGGTGSVGIEALSQGADHCIFLDLSAAAVKTIKQNLATTGLSEKAEVRHVDAFGYLRRCSKTFDLIFIAPPQYKGLWSEAMRELSERPALLADDGMIVVQIDPSEDEALELGPFRRSEDRRYGKTSLLFFRK